MVQSDREIETGVQRLSVAAKQRAERRHRLQCGGRKRRPCDHMKLLRPRDELSRRSLVAYFHRPPSLPA